MSGETNASQGLTKMLKRDTPRDHNHNQRIRITAFMVESQFCKLKLSALWRTNESCGYLRLGGKKKPLILRQVGRKKIVSLRIFEAFTIVGV